VKGYNQEKGIDYEETFAPVIRLESIRMILDLVCHSNFKPFQMDVKSALLNGFSSWKMCMLSNLKGLKTFIYLIMFQT